MAKRDEEGLSVGEALLAFLMLAGMLYVAWIIAKWVIETREGKVVAGLAAAVVAVATLVGAIMGPPSADAAAAARPAFSTLQKPGGVLINDGVMTSGVLAVSPDGRSYASMTSSPAMPARTEVRRTSGGGREVCVTFLGGTSCHALAR